MSTTRCVMVYPKSVTTQVSNLLLGDPDEKKVQNGDALPWLLGQGYEIVSVTGCGSSNNPGAFLVVMRK